MFQSADFPITEFGIHGQAVANGGRFNGGQWPHIVIFISARFLGRIGGENKLGFAEPPG